MLQERRQNRSLHRGPALDLQLAACRRDGALDAIVVADADGLVVSSAGDPFTCELLAARGPTRSHDHGCALSDGMEESAFLFDAGGARLSVVARGSQRATRRRELIRAAAAVKRILTTY
ncbi:MAG: hypothetical protein U0271_47460 [Polyangiaceae bacterium]